LHHSDCVLHLQLVCGVFKIWVRGPHQPFYKSDVVGHSCLSTGCGFRI